MPRLLRFIPAVIALGLSPLGNAWAADTAPASSQTSSGTIIWDANKAAPATRGPNGTIIWNDSAAPQGAPQSPPRANATADKDGIIWDNPRAAQPQASAAPPAPDRNGITWNSPANAKPKSLAAAPPSTSTDAAGPCREFQTHIIIDGKSEPAHGTACRQPDGTWRVVNR